MRFLLLVYFNYCYKIRITIYFTQVGFKSTSYRLSINVSSFYKLKHCIEKYDISKLFTISVHFVSSFYKLKHCIQKYGISKLFPIYIQKKFYSVAAARQFNKYLKKRSHDLIHELFNDNCLSTHRWKRGDWASANCHVYYEYPI